MPTAVLSYGSTELQLGEAPRIVRRADGFDEGAFEFIGGTEDSLTPGNSVPGYNGMVIVEDSVTDHSGFFEHAVRATGLRSGSRRLIDSDAVDVEDGFDTGVERWAVSGTWTPNWGASHSDHNNLRAVSISAKRAGVDGLKFVDIQFKGIKTGGRPVRFRSGTLSREVTKDNVTLTVAGGDSSTAHDWNILLATGTLQRSYLSTVLPDTSSVGKHGAANAVSPDFPAIYTPPWVSSDSMVTWQWPHGVVLAALEYERIPGTTICFVTEHYVRREQVSL